MFMQNSIKLSAAVGREKT